MPRLAVVLTITLLAAAVPAAEPTKTDLFEAGKGGYALYRIPGVVVGPKGTVLVYCEARKSARGDWGKIDILMRRSTDAGATWEAPRQIVHLKGEFAKNPVAAAQKLGTEGEITVNNPVMIPDRKTGSVHFLYCVEYMRCFYTRSDDDGKTFADPVEITATFDAFRPAYAWKVLATGPGHGIQLRSGRLVVPAWLSTGTGGHAHRPSVVTTVYSDDHGKTWHRGEVIANETDPLTNPNETTAAELADGRVMVNIRSESKANRRAVAFSPDGATNWTCPTFDDRLAEPICMASLLKVPGGPLLFANPDNLDPAKGEPKPGTSRARKNLTVRLSPDDGKTWAAWKALEPGPSAYSDLAAGPDGWVYCAYERGADGNPYQRLTVARFKTDWLR